MSLPGLMPVLAEGGWDKLVVPALLGFMALGVIGAVLLMMGRAFSGWLGGSTPPAVTDETEAEKEKDSQP